MRDKTLLIIDGNNLLHRALHAYKQLSFGGKSVSAIYGVISLMNDALFKNRPEDVLMVWDGKRSDYRLAINPQYKKRDKGKLFDYDDFKRQRSAVIKLINLLGVKQIRNLKNEADDLIFKAAKIAIEKKGFTMVRILSSDKDFNQMISKNVMILNPSKNDLIHEDNCKGLFGYTPSETVEYLSIVGDDSDNIKGYPGLGPKKTRDLLDEYGSFQNILSTRPGKLKLDYKLLEKVLKDNRKLIDLEYFNRMNNELVPLTFIFPPKEVKFKPKSFKKLCQMYGLKRFQNKGFMGVFKRSR